jgi:nitrile hydratase
VARASDLGGLRGLGPVVVEADEPVFRSGWERRMFGIAMAVSGRVGYSLDEDRFAIEDMPPVAYLGGTYYARWLWGLERLLAQYGLVSAEELDERTRAFALHPERRPGRREDPAYADAVMEAVRQGVSSRREIDAPRRFGIGDRVLARGTGTRGHTRLPAYARGRVGAVVRCHDAFVLPDTNALREGESPQWCYSVRFEARELWGDAAEAAAPVIVDLWEGYLEPVA